MLTHVIWSEQHKAWWRRNGCGYTDSLAQAGLYSEEEASRIVESANMGSERFNELALPVPSNFKNITTKRTER